MESECGKDRFPHISLSDPRKTLFHFRTRPLSMADALAMAEFAGDYSPVHLFPRANRDMDGGRPELHPFWITGLVDGAVRLHFPGCRPARLVVAHHSPALVGESLSVTAILVGRCSDGKRLDLEFGVSTDRGRPVASGTVRVNADDTDSQFKG